MSPVYEFTYLLDVPIPTVPVTYWNYLFPNTYLWVAQLLIIALGSFREI